MDCRSMKKFGRDVRKEWNKIQKLKGYKKAEYLWEYYKPALGLIMAAVLIAGGIKSSVSKAQEEILLSVAVIDADRERADAYKELEKNLEDVLGNGAKNERVVIDTSATSGERPEEVMNTTMKLSVVEDYDAVILNQAEWKKFRKQDAFADWEEILGETYPLYEPYIEDGALLLSESGRWNSGKYVQYEPAYLCVLDRSVHKEKIEQFVEYFMGR